jgi:hypothetical protein
MRNPKNTQRRFSLRVPQGTLGVALSGSWIGLHPFRSITHTPLTPVATLPNPMKANSTPTHLKTRTNPSLSKPSELRPDGQLFLGNKVLGELRILMRLASPALSGTGPSNNGGSGHSY